MVLHDERHPALGMERSPSEGGAATPGPTFELHRLEWDTAFFGAQMGVVVLTGEAGASAPEQRAAALERNLRTLLVRANAERYAHLILRVPAEDLPMVWAAERAGLRLVDVGIDSTFSLQTTPLPPPPQALSIRPAGAEDLPTLRELAATAFILSRFAADPFFSAEQVAAFHREWVTNLYGGLAQAVLVCEVAGALAGFVTCALSGDEGRIPLIATQSGYRRQGLGRGLVSTALRWFAAAGARVAHVKTQAHNYSALALYHRAGFSVSKTELTFSVALSPVERQ
jgi:ribosomal protein S18 acetylase RimI-like enzyme